MGFDRTTYPLCMVCPDDLQGTRTQLRLGGHPPLEVQPRGLTLGWGPRVGVQGMVSRLRAQAPGHKRDPSPDRRAA